ncbi:MAG: GNAT family N-acetyltransferase [Lentisphaeria bacterium]|nr:GNAT family N-acetyltransferase [Lentisphaeria bacterium]
MDGNNAEIRIREITDPEELKTVESLAGKIFPPTYADLIPAEQIPYMMRLMYDDAVLRKEVADGMKYALITDADVPIGYISWHLTEIDGCKVMRLEKLYLDFSYHGRFIGNMGLRHVIEAARRTDASCITLNVHRRNFRAQNAYLRAGFYRWRCEKEDVGNGFFKDDYIMRYDIVRDGDQPHL